MALDCLHFLYKTSTLIANIILNIVFRTSLWQPSTSLWHFAHKVLLLTSTKCRFFWDFGISWSLKVEPSLIVILQYWILKKEMLSSYNATFCFILIDLCLIKIKITINVTHVWILAEMYVFPFYKILMSINNFFYLLNVCQKN